MHFKQVFANPEDTTSGGTVAYADSDVERVRRAHQNDLENIPLFLLAAHFYLTTNPSPTLATNLIRAFTCMRFAHSFVYVNQVRSALIKENLYRYVQGAYDFKKKEKKSSLT